MPEEGNDTEKRRAKTLRLGVLKRLNPEIDLRPTCDSNRAARPTAKRPQPKARVTLRRGCRHLVILERAAAFIVCQQRDTSDTSTWIRFDGVGPRPPFLFS